MNSIFNCPSELILKAGKQLMSRRAFPISSEKWQGLELDQKMIECFDNTYRFFIPDSVEDLKLECTPDLSWADDHFKERISGNPTNPGDTFKQWPYYKEDSYREGGIFTHTYQERFWPKRANLSTKELESPNSGIRFPYGDLGDLINHLAENPSTRQAYLPIWFPEDTGVLHNGRVPCTLGYLFNYRDGFLHLSHYIRSCDYIRHFRNDIYFTSRLLLHVLDELKMKNSPIRWNKVRPGRIKMDVESLHIFQSDVYELKKRINRFNI
mgnify:CR=1 FL=1